VVYAQKRVSFCNAFILWNNVALTNFQNLSHAVFSETTRNAVHYEVFHMRHSTSFVDQRLQEAGTPSLSLLRFLSARKADLRKGFQHLVVVVVVVVVVIVVILWTRANSGSPGYSG
jgi:hypothetical protein